MEPTNDRSIPETPGAATTPRKTATTSRSAKAAGTTTGTIPTNPSAPTAPAAGGVQEVVSSALASGKKWLDDSGLLQQAGQLPQQAKDLGQQALSRVNSLTNTQKVVGLGLLTAGIAFLATRGKGRQEAESEYRPKPRRSPFDDKKSGSNFGRSADRAGAGAPRAWGSSPYGAGVQGAGSARISAGSGYGYRTETGGAGTSPAVNRGGNSAPSGQDGGQRRDQGPGRYDAHAGGRQNPNNIDDLSGAF